MIVLLVGADIFPNLGVLSWIGLGVIGTIGTLAAGLPSPIFGRMADKYRRGTMMFISTVLSAGGSLLIGLFGESFIVMVFGVILMGLGLALYHPPGLSWISTAFEDPETHSYSSNYVRILALHGIGGSLGAAIGPLSVYFLINTITWRQIYFYWSIPIIILAIGFWIFVGRYESHFNPSISLTSQGAMSTDEKNLSKLSKYSALIFIFSFIIVMSLTRGMVNFILSPFLSEMKNVEIATAALFVGISALVGALGQFFGGVLGDRLGERMVLCFSAILQVVILVGLFFLENYIIILGFYIFLGIINALFWPSTNSLVAKNSAQRGVAFGWVMLIANFIGALGPSIDGFLLVIDPNQYLLIFLFASLFSLCGFLTLLFLKSNPQKVKNPY